MVEAEYPAPRGSQYGIRYLKWLIKVDYVREIGINGFALLSFIAAKEDQNRYSRPVGYREQQLATELGVTRQTLRTTRAKLVKMGLLSFKPGSRSRDGRYFTFGMPTDCGQNLDSIDVRHGDGCGQNLDSIQPQSNHNPTNTIPKPNPNPKYIPIDSSVESVFGEKPKASTNRSSKAISGFDEWYSLYPRKESKGDAEKAYPKAIKAIQEERNVDQAEAVEILLQLTRERLPSLRKTEPQYVPHPSKWLNAKKFFDQVAKVGGGDEEYRDLTGVGG